MHSASRIAISSREDLSFCSVRFADGDPCGQLSRLADIGHLDEASEKVSLPGLQEWIVAVLL
jgi:hypothetical protein